MRALGTIIAERKLNRTDGNGKRKTVTVRIGQPIADGKDHYYVPWQITGLGEPRKIRKMHGVDSMQALVLAFEAVHLYLSMLKNIRWFDFEDLNLLPRDLTKLVSEEEAKKSLQLESKE